MWETDVEELADQSNAPIPEPLYPPPEPLYPPPDLQDPPLIEQAAQFEEVLDTTGTPRATTPRPKQKRKKRNNAASSFFYITSCLFLSFTASP